LFKEGLAGGSGRAFAPLELEEVVTYGGFGGASPPRVGSGRRGEGSAGGRGRVPLPAYDKSNVYYKVMFEYRCGNLRN